MLKQGIVSEVKEWPSKYKWPDGNPKPSNYTFKIDDGERYGIKGKPPAGLKAGDNVQFDANKNAKGYWEVDPVTIVPGSAAPSQAQSAPVGTKSPATGGSYKSTEVQNAISFQAARKDALETTSMLLQHGLIDFGKAKGAQKIEIVEIFIDNYTVRYAEDTARLAPKPHGNPLEAEYGEGVVEAKKSRGRPKAAPKPKEGALPAEEDDDLPW